MYSCIRDQEFTLAGFPHSDICGLMDICSLPQLFAACHVLLRLSVPRHSPCALCNLTCCGSLLRRYPDTDEAFPKTCSSSSFGTCVPVLFYARPYFFASLCLLSSQSSFLMQFSRCIQPVRLAPCGAGGDNENRTRDLLLARQALSQLSYAPMGFQGPGPEN